MIDISDKTFDEILQSMLLRVTQDVNKRDGSLIKTALAACAWSLEGLYLELANVQRQAYGVTASGDYLDLKAAERGVNRKPATRAICKAVFNLIVDKGLQFSSRNSDSNLTYEVTGDCVPVAGGYECEITCLTAGAIGNSYTGALSPLSFVSGLTTATLTSISIPGNDIESDDSLRKRYAESLIEIAFAGNIAAYREFVLAQSGVGAMRIFPTWDGPGTVRISIVDEEFNPCTPEFISEIQTKVCPLNPETNNPDINGFGMAPIGAAVSIVTPTQTQLDIQASIKLDGTRTVESIKAEAELACKAYIKSVQDQWGNAPIMGQTNVLTLYTNQILARIALLEGVANVDWVSINGSVSNLRLYQSAQLQQIPTFYLLTLITV